MDIINKNLKMHNKIIDDYVDHIKNNIKNCYVLDVGCCATNPKNLMKRHIEYSKTARKIIGIDYNKKLLKKASSDLGINNLYYCDVTNNVDVDSILYSFGKFDHVICTDIIEHVGNLTLFLDNINRLMSSNGLLYITTPNSRSIRWFIRSYKSNDFKINSDHVCWFDISTLSALLNRSGMKVNELMYCVDDEERQEAKDLGLKFKNCLARKLYIIVSKI